MSSRRRFFCSRSRRERKRRDARWSAGVLAGWPGCVLAAEPPNPQISLVTTTRASLPFGGGDAAEPAGETPALRRANVKQCRAFSPRSQAQKNFFGRGVGISRFRDTPTIGTGYETL